jgi:hypothetical protein
MSMRISTLVVLLRASADAFSQYSAITAAARGLAKSRCFAKRAPPPPPAFKPKPLPVILAGGLFLFGSSVNPNDRKLVDKLLVCVQRVLDKDPTITMALGQGTTTGGVYSSLRETSPDGIEKIIAQFQIEGGNVWAQGIAYGTLEVDSAVRLLSLQVANMDASLNGTPFFVPIPEFEELPEASG